MGGDEKSFRSIAESRVVMKGRRARLVKVSS